LLETGFRTWSKHDFWKFVNGCEKYGRSSYEKISRKLEKDISEVELYAKVFWSRIDELSDKEKILRMIQNG
jgi:SWI/SNF-related matrix-associated actin-dependent regulator of chromatin subfamily A member 5